MKKSKKHHKSRKPKFVNTIEPLLDIIERPMIDWVDKKDKRYISLLIIDANAGLSIFYPLYQGQQYPEGTDERLDADSMYEYMTAHCIYHDEDAHKTFDNVGCAMDIIFETDPKNAHLFKQHDDNEQEEEA